MTFGLADDHYHRRVSPDYLAEANPHLDIWMLLQCGALVEGAITELAWGDPVGGLLPAHNVNLRREAPNLWIDQTRVAVVWDEPMPGVGRPWFECSACLQKCRYVYLRASIACARCHKLQNASRHLHRQTPGVHRVRRWRRQIGAEERPFGVIPDRPRHHVRFHRIVAKIHAEEARLVAHLGGIVYDLDRRLRGRRGRKKHHDRTKATPRPDSASS